MLTNALRALVSMTHYLFIYFCGVRKDKKERRFKSTFLTCLKFQMQAHCFCNFVFSAFHWKDSDLKVIWLNFLSAHTGYSSCKLVHCFWVVHHQNCPSHMNFSEHFFCCRVQCSRPLWLHGPPDGQTTTQGMGGTVWV